MRLDATSQCFVCGRMRHRYSSKLAEQNFVATQSTGRKESPSPLFIQDGESHLQNGPRRSVIIGIFKGNVARYFKIQRPSAQPHKNETFKHVVSFRCLNSRRPQQISCFKVTEGPHDVHSRGLRCLCCKCD